MRGGRRCTRRQNHLNAQSGAARVARREAHSSVHGFQPVGVSGVVLLNGIVLRILLLMVLLSVASLIPLRPGFPNGRGLN